VIGFLIVFCAIIFFAPDMGGYFLEYNNFVPANPMKTPEHIAPVWYFHAVLRDPACGAADVRFAVPGRGGDGRGDRDLLCAAVAGSRQGQFDPLPRPDLQTFLTLFVISFVGLGYLGLMPATPTYHAHLPGSVRGVLRILLPDALVYQDRQVQARA